MASNHRVVERDITIYQGMDHYDAFRCIESDGTVPDLEDWTATLRVYRAPAAFESIHDEAPIITGSTSDGKVSLGHWTDADFGPYNVLTYLSSALTSALDEWGVGVYMLDLIDPFDHVQVRVRGRVTLEEGTTYA